MNNEVGFFRVKVLAPEFLSSRGRIFLSSGFCYCPFLFRALENFSNDFTRSDFFLLGIHKVGFFCCEVFTRSDFFVVRYLQGRIFSAQGIYNLAFFEGEVSRRSKKLV